MAVLSLTKLWRIAIQGQVVSSSGQVRPVWNVFHYNATAEPPLTFTLKVELAAHFNTQVWSFVAGLLAAEYTGVNIWIWRLSSIADAPAIAGTPSNGGVAGGRLPTNVAVFGKTRSPLRGRNYQGSKRFSPIALSHTSGDELTPAAWALWQGTIGGLASNFNFTSTTGAFKAIPVIYSRKLSDVHHPSLPQVGVQMSAFSVYHTLSTWRHRRERTQL